MLEFVQREGTRCLKYDALPERFGQGGLLPLWVADMDCRVPRVVLQALARQLEHGVYGYYSEEQEAASKAAVLSWLQNRHGVLGLGLENCQIYAGVLEALAVCIEVLCPVSEAVILNSPAYNCFYRNLAKTGRRIVENYLELSLEGSYHMDFALLERQIQQSGARLFLLCSPHNPVGKVWPEEDLRRLLELCQKYDLYLISDEIHFDLLYPGLKHRSILDQELSSIHSKVAMISAPSKTFNIPSLRSAYLVSRSPEIIAKTHGFCDKFQIGDISLPGHTALEVCYTAPDAVQWLDELLLYLQGNRDYLHDYLRKEFPELQHRKPEASYLYWIDCRHFLGGDSQALRKFFIDAGLALGWGDLYHGDGWVRLNFACERSLLEAALENWKKAYLNLAL